MKIENIVYDNFIDFFKSLLPTGELSKKINNGFIFRGESSNKYELIPSALRKVNKKRIWGIREPINNQSEWERWQIFGEYQLLRDFYKTANNSGLKVPYIKDIRDNFVDVFPSERLSQSASYKWLTREIGELAALAQHYGIVTRLIDWTTDPFVSLYFASIGAMNRIRNKTMDQNDTIVIWALNSQYIQYLQKTTSRIPLNFVVPSYSDNPNLNAQKGVLTYWEIEMIGDLEEMKLMQKNLPFLTVDRTPLNELLSHYCRTGVDDHITLLYKFEFPAIDSYLVYESIRQIGYSAAKMFPGYNGVTRKMDEDRMYLEIATKKKHTVKK